MRCLALLRRLAVVRVAAVHLVVLLVGVVRHRARAAKMFSEGITWVR